MAYHRSAPRLVEDRKSVGAGSTVVKKLGPGAPGIKRIEARFGADLVCVRYRIDPENHRRLTTVELIVDERPVAADTFVRIDYRETQLRQAVKNAGGVWDAERKLWQVSAIIVRQLKLQPRVVKRKG